METIRKLRFKNRKGAEIPFSTGAWNKTPAYFCEDTTPYRTDCYEVIFFHQVEGMVHLDGVPIALRDHTMLFIAPQRKRRWNITNPHLNAQFLRFQEDFVHDLLVDKTFLDRLDCFFKPQVPLFLQPDDETYQKINGACFEIWREMEHFQPDSLHIVRSLVYFIATTANRAYRKAHGLEENLACDGYASRFKRLLEEHIITKRLVEEYACLLNISRVTLNKLVKKQYGTTASEMIRQRLLQEIKNRLLHTDKSISEISYDLYFPEPSHLVRFFRQAAQLTPKEFRLQHAQMQPV